MENKSFLASKLNWLGIAAVGTAVIDFIAKYDDSTWDWKTIALFGVGLATVVIRTYFTASAIK